MKRAVKPAVLDIGRRFFSRDSKVSLNNLSLWNECQKLCSAQNKRLGDKTDLSVLWRAHDTVVTKLDDIHQPFLLTQINGTGGVLGEAMQCLLSIL